MDLHFQLLIHGPLSLNEHCFLEGTKKKQSAVKNTFKKLHLLNGQDTENPLT